MQPGKSSTHLLFPQWGLSCLDCFPKTHVIVLHLTLQLSSQDGIIILCINFKEHHGRGYRKTGRTKKNRRAAKGYPLGMVQSIQSRHHCSNSSLQWL